MPASPNNRAFKNRQHRPGACYLTVCGVRQLFDGEDLGAGDRTKAQMSQCQSWWDQQKKEREALKVTLETSYACLALPFDSVILGSA